MEGWVLFEMGMELSEVAQTNRGSGRCGTAVQALISLCLENPPHNPRMKKEQVSSSTLHCPTRLRRQETHPSTSTAHEPHPTRLLLPASSSLEGMLQPHGDGHSQEHSIVKVQKELSDHQMQPSTPAPCSSPDHALMCHIHIV